MRTRTSTWLIVAAITLLIVVVAAWIVMPHQSEHWEMPDTASPDAALVDRVLVIERRTGFRIGDRGLSMTNTARIPYIHAKSALSAVMFYVLTHDVKTMMRIEDDMISWRDVLDAFLEKPPCNAWESVKLYRIVTDSPTVISLLEINYCYTGGAHGYTSLSGRNFVQAGGKVSELTTLDDLFEPGSGWFTVLAHDTEADLRKQKAGLLDQALPFKPEDFQAFTISREGLRIHFAPYEVGTYAEGMLTVIEPWAKLRPYMKADSVVTRWVDEQMKSP